MSKNKNKRGKHTKTNNKNTHTSFSCCCCGWEEAGKIIKITCSFFVFGTSHTPCKEGGLHRRDSRDREERRFGLFYLVDDLMD
jgi:hypothetical protein